MRRRLGQCIPIVAIALLAQLIAPIGAFRVVAAAASDPVAIASICSGMPAAQNAPTIPSGAPQADGNCCAVCAVGLGNPPMASPVPQTFVTLHRQYLRVVWPDAVGVPTVIRPGSNAQPRAPPST